MSATYICQLSCDFCEGDDYSALIGDQGHKIDHLREHAATIGWTRVEIHGLRYDRCRECTEAGKVTVANQAVG